MVPEYEEKPIPRWQKTTGAIALAVTIVCLVAFRTRLGADFWPLDASRVAPNLLASVIQWAVVLSIAAVLWPPTRRRIHQFVTRHTAPLHAHHERMEAAHADLQRRLDHIIDHHPDIPELPPSD